MNPEFSDTYSSPGFGGSRWPCRAIGLVEKALYVCSWELRERRGIVLLVARHCGVIVREEEVRAIRRRDCRAATVKADILKESVYARLLAVGVAAG